MINPLSGTRLYSFNLVCAEPIAFSTDNLFTRDLMFDAVPISSVSILFTKFTWPFGGMTREIIEVPFPRASVKPLINYFIIASSQKKKRSANAREKKARDRERRTKTRVLFVSLVYYEQKRHTERARARRIRKPHHHSSSGLSPTENKHNTRPKKKSASRAQGPLTFLIFHISMFSSWSSPMDAILFSSLSSLFSLFCVRTRERSDVVF